MKNKKNQIRKIGVLDTSVASENYGDVMIMDSAKSIIDVTFPDNHKITFPTHEKLGRVSFKLQRSIDFNVACGTNLLHSHMGLIRQWNIGLKEAFFLKPVVLLGVGWRSKKSRGTDFYTKWLLKKILSKKFIHSVRDSYTEEKLKEIGIHNVLNTSCPTMWQLDKAHCSGIPLKKGRNVLLVLTDYSQSKKLDQQLLKILKEEYYQVFFWCQGKDDYQYIQSLININDDVVILDANITTYNKLLSDDSISLDYVGTRLHGGIRALQKKRRTVIIGVDHRSMQKKEDFNLPVINRYVSKDELRQYITMDLPIDIRIPHDNIKTWVEQFDLNIEK